MDGIFTILVLFGIFSSIAKWVKKQQGSGQQGGSTTPDQPWKRMLGDVAKQLDDTISGKMPLQPAKLPPTIFKPVASSQTEGAWGGEGQSQASQSGSSVSYLAGGEGTGTPYAFSGEGVSTPLEPLPNFRGSMAGTLDAAYSSNESDVRAAVEPMQELNDTLRMSFDRQSLVKAIVMQEILTRPQDRRRRWSTH